MTVREIRDIAKTMKIKNISRFRKDGLVRVIQEAEGNSPCFKNIPNCGETQCLWRNDCLEG